METISGSYVIYSSFSYSSPASSIPNRKHEMVNRKQVKQINSLLFPTLSTNVPMNGDVTAI